MKYNLTINIFPTKHNPVYKVELNIEKKQNIRFLKNSKINLKNKKGIINKNDYYFIIFYNNS